MEFRRATMADLPALMVIVQEAIELLKQQGSPQWQNGYGPTQEKISKMIQKQEMYVLEDQIIVAMGALVHGIDPVYTAIEEGEWQGDAPYISIHRVAVARQFTGKGLAKKILELLVNEAKKQGIDDVRIDTHQLNVGMQKAILSSGFSYCGIVHFPVPEGERKAYQLK